MRGVSVLDLLESFDPKRRKDHAYMVAHFTEAIERSALDITTEETKSEARILAKSFLDRVKDKSFVKKSWEAFKQSPEQNEWLHRIAFFIDDE